MSDGPGVWYTASEDRVPISTSGFFVCTRVEALVPADTEPHDATLEIEYQPQLIDWNVLAFGARRSPFGDAITTESMREMAVGAALTRVTGAVRDLVVDADGLDFFGHWDRERKHLPDRRSLGPTGTNLSIVADFYLAARVLRKSATTIIATAFDLPARTAAHWIKLAKERGVLTLPDMADVALSGLPLEKIESENWHFDHKMPTAAFERFNRLLFDSENARG